MKEDIKQKRPRINPHENNQRVDESDNEPSTYPNSAEFYYRVRCPDYHDYPKISDY